MAIIAVSVVLTLIGLAGWSGVIDLILGGPLHGDWWRPVTTLHAGPGRDHYRRKQAEHKTAAEALRSLVRQLLMDSVSVFILPPSLEVLRQRLCARGTDTPEELDLRMRNAPA